MTEQGADSTDSDADSGSANVHDLESIIEALGNIALFAKIKPRGLKLLAEIASEENRRTGDLIFAEGETGGALYLILEGKVRISRTIAGMGEEALAVLGPGAAFGELSVFDDSPRSADAKVHSRARLLVIQKDALEDLMFLNKDLSYELLWNVVKILSARVRETNDKMTFLSATGRF